MAKSILLTGYPGIGKTTIIKHVITALGDQAGGFYTEEIFGAGGRHGFRLVTLGGKEAVIAHKDLRAPNVPRIGRYGIDVPTFERVGVRELRRAMAGGKIIIVDEIGPMELYSQLFQQTVMEAIMGPHHIIGTIMQKSHPEADAFKYLAQVEVRDIDRRNRDDMPARILKWVGANISGRASPSEVP
jgi:nucleoside-triphosphatase